jgi:hypothetical protein
LHNYLFVDGSEMRGLEPISPHVTREQSTFLVAEDFTNGSLRSFLSKSETEALFGDDFADRTSRRKP